MKKGLSPPEAGGLPASVQKFILQYFHSVEQLEVLLLLRRQQDQDFTATQISSELKGSETSIVKRLEDLEIRGLIKSHSNANGAFFRFSSDSEVKAQIDELASYYKTHSVRIIEIIYSRPKESLRIFADAFRFRPDGKN